MLSLVGTASALAVTNQRQSSAYYYYPLDFDYGVDSRFTSNLTFGTYANGTAKQVKMVMDTGSANTWTWAPSGTVNWGSPYLATPGPCNATAPTGYEPSLSTSQVASQSNHSFGYAYAGNAKIVSGTVYVNDTIAPASGGGAALPNSQFALVDYMLIRQTDDGTCSSVPSYDKGIVGLAPYIDNVNLAPGPLLRKDAYNAGALSSEVLFLWMDAFTGTIGDTLTGGLLLGAVDSSKYTGDLVRVQSSQAYGTVGPYVVKPTVSFANVTTTPDADVDCLVDSGAHADVLPFSSDSEAYAALFNETGGLLVDYYGIFAYNGTCDSIPTTTTIAYQFAAADSDSDSVTIDIPLRNFARGYDVAGTEGLCLLNLEYDASSCTLGATFLTGAAMALDDADNSVAFAQGGISVAGSGVDEASFTVLS